MGGVLFCIFGCEELGFVMIIFGFLVNLEVVFRFFIDFNLLWFLVFGVRELILIFFDV